jgi:hypothetical protein
MKPYYIVTLFLFATLTHAQIPAIADVPTCASAADRSSLEAARSGLLQQRSDLKSQTAQHNSRCASIPASSPENGPCQASQGQLQAAISHYAESVKTYNAHTLAANAACPPSSDHPHPKIGAAADVRGTVYWLTSDGRKILITSGTPVFLNTHIITEGDGHFQVLLLDETVFTLGPNSDMVLDEFVYDPNTNLGKVTASIAKGTFRFVTGKMSHKDPAASKVKLPVMVVGIRGTDFEVQYQPNSPGSIKLYRGEIDVTEIQSGKIFHMTAGQNLIITSDGKVAQP